ncbi:hypothetical protein [Streptomyces yangpuensis]|uniref:hypothetical protein n=1 Tax=Streptomyces yangpuensis TaxID=1648182 RepID=UPI0006293639|nr:hypothetical protein [Streptomyces yangpuensis]
MEWNADAAAWARLVPPGLRASSERALGFAPLWQERYGEAPQGPPAKGAEAVNRQEADHGPDGTVVAYPADPFLAEGAAPIFATRYSERIDRHVFLDAVHGRVPLTPQTTATWTDAVARQRTA